MRGWRESARTGQGLEPSRLVVDALQQDAKPGKGDEVAVLQRERKKRVEAAEAFEGADGPSRPPPSASKRS